jgi:hypothetical protein
MDNAPDLSPPPGIEIQERAENEVQYEGKMPIAERWSLLTWIIAISPSLTHANPESR